MNRHNINLLDLPNEILFLILRKLNNVDVLYSLLGTNHQRLETVAQQEIFTNILNFVYISESTDETLSIPVSMLLRFCASILPKIHLNVKTLILESGSIERILRAGTYPNLTTLKIFNFNKSIVSRYFMDDSLFVHDFQQQITDIVLVSNEDSIEITPKEYTKNVYAIIFAFFKNLKHLSIVPSSINDYPPLSLCSLPPMTCSSSILRKLCVNVTYLHDVFAILDGRFKHLNTLIVQVRFIDNLILPRNIRFDLTNLNCFSLTCYRPTMGYTNQVLPLLRQMSYLEELTLYFIIMNESTVISGIHLENEILFQMPRLQSFLFYFLTENVIDHDTDIRILKSDIQQSFINMKYEQVVSIVDLEHGKVRCHSFSLPFKFRFLQRIGNNFPSIVFNSVTHLKLWDGKEFRHEFFVRLTRAFPFLQKLVVCNKTPTFIIRDGYKLRDKDWCSIIEYPHLISLDIENAFFHYIENFLNETKTRLPRLKELKIIYHELENVTQNFTRNETRRNCSKVNLLIVRDPMIYSKDVYNYFPSLSSSCSDII